MHGTASFVRREQEGSRYVLRFVLARSDGTRAAVEMRGDEIQGVLNDGDFVFLEAMRAIATDGVHRPDRLRNESTGSAVVAWQRSRLQRAFKPVATTLTSAVISTGVTLFMTAQLSGDDSREPPRHVSDEPAPPPDNNYGITTGPSSLDERPIPAPAASDDPMNDIDQVVLLGGSLLLLVALLVFLLRIRRGARPTGLLWPIGAGLVLGVLIAACLTLL